MSAKHLCRSLRWAMVCVLFSCVAPVFAQEISGEGSQNGVGVNLKGGTAEAVRLSVTSTGAGWARSSFAQGTGVIASGGDSYTVNGVDVTAQSGLSVQEHPGSAVADSQALAVGVQMRGSTAGLAAESVNARAATGEARASSADGAYVQAISGSTVTGVWMTAPGSLQLSGDSVVESRGGTASTTGGSGEAVASAQAAGARVRQGNAEFRGSLTVRAIGGQAEASSANIYAEATASATGMEVDDGTVRSSANIRVEAVGGTAVYAEQIGQEAGRTFARAFGVFGSGNVVNTGNMLVTATGGTVTSPDGVRLGFGSATGIKTPGNIEQYGSVSVSASGAGPQGIGLSGAAVGNMGTLNVAVQGTGGVDGTATGIAATGSVVQSGTVTVSLAGAGTATGISTAGDVQHSGETTVTASGAGTATGIVMQGGTLRADGPVLARAESGAAWQVRSASVDSPVRVQVYNLGLGSETSRTFDGPGGVIMDQAELLLRPAVGFVPNQYYQVQSVDGGTPPGGVQTGSELGAASISGTVARVTSLHPDLTADMRTLAEGISGVGGEKTGGLDARGPVQSVALRYDPPASMPGESAKARLSTVLYAGTLVRDQMESRVLSAGTDADEAHRARLFMRPYAAELRFNGSAAGYHGQVAGAVAGVDWLAQGWVLGLHVGGDETRLDFRGVYAGRDEDSTAVYAGLHGGRQFDNGLVTMFSSTLFRVDHRADHSVGHIRETARSRTLAWYNTASLGYVWRVAEGQTIIPEIGLSHVWQFRNNYNTETPPEALNTRFSELDDHELFANAGLRWVGEFPLGSGTLRLHAGGGVRQTLTDGKVRIEQRMDGAAWTAPTTSSDRTVGYASVGVGMDGERFSWDVSVMGDTSRRASTLGAQAMLRWAF